MLDNDLGYISIHQSINQSINQITILRFCFLEAYTEFALPRITTQKTLFQSWYAERPKLARAGWLAGGVGRSVMKGDLWEFDLFCCGDWISGIQKASALGLGCQIFKGFCSGLKIDIIHTKRGRWVGGRWTSHTCQKRYHLSFWHTQVGRGVVWTFAISSCKDHRAAFCSHPYASPLWKKKRKKEKKKGKVSSPAVKGPDLVSDPDDCWLTLEPIGCKAEKWRSRIIQSSWRSTNCVQIRVKLRPYRKIEDSKLDRHIDYGHPESHSKPFSHHGATERPYPPSPKDWDHFRVSAT